MTASENLAFPRLLIIRIVDLETGEPIERIAVRITLFAKHKNDYQFAPNLSNADGRIVVERKWVRNSIEANREFFLMDYQSTIDDCLPQIEISAMTSQELEAVLTAADLYGAEQKRLGVALTPSDLKTASNQHYLAASANVVLNEAGIDKTEVDLGLRSAGQAPAAASGEDEC